MENKKESAAMNTAKKSISDILYEQLVLLAERSNSPDISTKELCELTSAIAELIRNW